MHSESCQSYASPYTILTCALRAGHVICTIFNHNSAMLSNDTYLTTPITNQTASVRPTITVYHVTTSADSTEYTKAGVIQFMFTDNIKCHSR